ncbi:MAG: hypothetical protein AAF497_25990 [Planctomycetota bacterium]
MLIFLFATVGAAAWLSQKDAPLHASATGVRFPNSLDVSQIDFETASNRDSKRTPVAIALTYPGMKSPPIWRDPYNLAPKSIPQLRKEFAAFLLEAPTSPESPVLSIIMRSFGDRLAPHIESFSAIDLRTGAEVYCIAPPFFRYEVNANQWTRVSIPLGIWHDTPLLIRVSPTSREDDTWPMTKDQATNIWVSDRAFHTELGIVSEIENPQSLSDHMFWGADLEFPIYLSIPGLPDMPNSRNLDNFFQARIPQLQTRDPLTVVRRATELRKFDPFYRFFPPPPGGYKSELSRIFLEGHYSGPPKTYQDITVFELLQKYSKSRESRPRFEVSHDSLFEDKPQTWTEQLKSWWRNHAPDWIQ